MQVTGCSCGTDLAVLSFQLVRLGGGGCGIHLYCKVFLESLSDSLAHLNELVHTMISAGDLRIANQRVNTVTGISHLVIFLPSLPHTIQCMRSHAFKIWKGWACTTSNSDYLLFLDLTGSEVSDAVLETILCHIIVSCHELLELRMKSKIVHQGNWEGRVRSCTKERGKERLQHSMYTKWNLNQREGGREDTKLLH